MKVVVSVMVERMVVGMNFVSVVVVGFVNVVEKVVVNEVVM